MLLVGSDINHAAVASSTFLSGGPFIGPQLILVGLTTTDFDRMSFKSSTMSPCTLAILEMANLSTIL